MRMEDFRAEDGKQILSILKERFAIDLPKNPFSFSIHCNSFILFFFFPIFEMGERRDPRVVDSQSTALIHLATSAPWTKSEFRGFFQMETKYKSKYK